MGFMKVNSLNRERSRVLKCPCKNMITGDGNESQISSNTGKTIIIQVTCTVNILQMSKSLPTFRGYIRFNTLVRKFYFFERRNKFSKISLFSHLSRHHDDLRVGKTIKEDPLCLRVASRSVYYQF